LKHLTGNSIHHITNTISIYMGCSSSVQVKRTLANGNGHIDAMKRIEGEFRISY